MKKVSHKRFHLTSQYKNFEEQFTFDTTGNFANYKQDATGDGTFELNQSRTHSKANEIATLGGSSSNILSGKNGCFWGLLIGVFRRALGIIIYYQFCAMFIFRILP
jgi:hypothetical protein